MAHELTDLPRRSVSLRPATPADRDFLFDVYASTRTEELAPIPWSDDQKRSFLRSQAEAQDAYYRDVYPKARFLVVTSDGQPIGRLYLVRLADEIRIIDIALLPGARGQGIGTALVMGVISDAVTQRLAVRLHVEPWNPAKRIYERLGFSIVRGGEVHELMELAPPADEGQLKTAS